MGSDELLSEAVTVHREERGDLIFEAQRILADEAPMIPLYYPGGTYGYRPQAHDSWVPVPAHGILHKLSFLPAGTTRFEPVSGSTAGDGLVPDGAEGAAENWWLWGGLALALLAVAAVVVSRARASKKPEREPTW